MLLPQGDCYHVQTFELATFCYNSSQFKSRAQTHNNSYLKVPPCPVNEDESPRDVLYYVRLWQHDARHSQRFSQSRGSVEGQHLDLVMQPGTWLILQPSDKHKETNKPNRVSPPGRPDTKSSQL